VLTFAAGPTNSLRGSSWLSGVESAIVADIGGTTTDVGVLVSGYPRQSSLHVDIGGVRTNFRMPDLASIGLGGGSRVRSDNGRVRVGPDSVARRLTEEALVFGGATLTASDIAVRRGHARFGDKGKVTGIDAELAEAADGLVHRMLEDAVDRMKTSAGAAPLILVGGGAALIARPLAGVSEIIRPEHADVANAIGAAIGQIGADVDRIFNGDALTREALVELAREEAFERAVAAGAKRESLQLVELDILPLQYLPGGAQRVVCRAVGDLNLSNEAQDEAQSQRRGRFGGGFSLFGNRRRG
jgi:N-methylhydantoinase A/oxoprolinase/acetone carboxylase beta subunit